jgi:Raf kinase inhibitor-like YbhB/YbcL family protein
VALMAALVLESSAFEQAQAIPSHYTCDGDDLSPPLSWANVPDEAQSLALLVDDPDAPRGVFTHWVAWGLDRGAGGLGEGEAPPGEGRNDFGTVGYRGPCPPAGHGPHRYVFHLYALERDLHLDSEAGKSELAQAIDGHVLTVAELVGTYER